LAECVLRVSGCIRSGEVQYLHPKDGVYPEKVNPGRKSENFNKRRIGAAVNPVDVKFTGKTPYQS
jgi:photosystem I subunit 2